MFANYVLDDHRSLAEYGKGTETSCITLVVTLPDLSTRMYIRDEFRSGFSRDTPNNLDLHHIAQLIKCGRGPRALIPLRPDAETRCLRSEVLLAGAGNEPDEDRAPFG